MSLSSTRVREFTARSFTDTVNNRLTDVAGSFEDRLKLTSAFALIGGMRLEDLTLDRAEVDYDGSTPEGPPFSKRWTPVSYRAAYTYEPIHDLMFYRCTQPPTIPRSPVSSPSPRNVAAINQRAHLRNRRQADPVERQGRVDGGGLQHRPAQRLCPSQHHDN